MQKKSMFICTFLFSALLLLSYTNISGDMGGTTLSSGTYYVTGDIYVSVTETFTIEPDAVMKFAPGFDLTVYGTLNAIGLNGSGIIFTSMDDDYFGEQITGSDSAPNPGEWEGIYFNGIGVNEGICEMDYCNVRFAGAYLGNSYTNLYFQESNSGYFTNGMVRFSEGDGVQMINCSLNFVNSIIRDNAYDGLDLSGSNSTIDNCNILGNSHSGIRCDGSTLTISNNTISNNTNSGILVIDVSDPTITGNTITSNNYGIYVDSPYDNLTANGNTIENNTAYPIRCYPHNVSGLYSNTFTGNTNQQIYVEGGTVSEDASWEDQGIPYYIPSSETIIVQGLDGVDNVTTLTIEPGVTIEFDTSGGVYIGHDSNSNYPGALVADGTEIDQITFTSASATPSPTGDWSGIYFANYSNDSICILDNSIIEYGGYSVTEAIQCYNSSPTITYCTIRYNGNSGIYCDNAFPEIDYCDIQNNSSYGIYCDTSGPQITNSIISNNASYGIYVYDISDPYIGFNTISSNGSYGIYMNSASDDATVTGNTITDNSSYPIFCYAGNVKNITGNTFGGNAYEQIYVYGETITTDAIWTNQGIPYRVSSAAHVYVQGTDGTDNITTLTISPGTEIQFDTVFLWIGHATSVSYPGALVADGTEAEPITFTSAQVSPVAGDWLGIYFAEYANDATCILDNCIIEYGGNLGNYSNVDCYQSSPTITNCRIGYGEMNSIYCYGVNSTPVIENCTLFDNSEAGIFSNLGSPTISGCEVYNCQYGIVAEDSGASMTISTSNIHDNSSYGILLDFSSPTVSGNTVSGNGSYGIYVVNSSIPEISSNMISSNSYGIYLYGPADDATITGNSITDNSSYPIRCYAGSINNITGNTFGGNTSDKIFVYGETISTDATWTNQGIPYYVSSSAHIYVQGTNGLDNITTLTINPGTEIQFDSVYLYIGHNSSSSYPGALIAAGTGAEPITFTSSETTPAAGDWYGIYFANYSDDSTCILDNCVIEYGGDTGNYDIVNCYNCSPIITNCDIGYGENNGIFSYGSGAAPMISNCEIYNNAQAGIFSSYSTATISYCDIFNNSQYGIACEQNSATVNTDNCTVYGNNSGYYGGSNSKVDISNSIYWGNTTNGIYENGSMLLNVSYTDSQEFIMGIGNVSFEPHLNNPAMKDFTLRYSSPCINAGNPASPIDPDGTIADMGAHYFDMNAGVPVLTSVSDIPNDQGRQVQIVWDKSPYDANGSMVPIEDYSLWRYDEIYRTSDEMNIYENPEDIFQTIQTQRDDELYWNRNGDILTYIDLVPAMGFQQYSYVSPTLADSSTSDVNYSSFIVFAHTDFTLMYFTAEADSGYSLDNIAPLETRAYIAENVNSMRISWDEVEYGMFEGNLYPEQNGVWYKVYASDSPDFVCDETTYLTTVTESEYDFPTTGKPKQFFKVIVNDQP